MGEPVEDTEAHAIKVRMGEPVEDVEAHGVKFKLGEPTEDVEGHGLPINANEPIDEDVEDTGAHLKFRLSRPERAAQGTRLASIGRRGLGLTRARICRGRRLETAAPGGV